ncbi:MAG: hypothetical protein QOD42_629, partial [Sphingomonadales bacterium]|nr:hypothetical protein [Sphingomonadales bacterium]
MKKRDLNYLTNINGTPGDDVLIGTADNDIIDGGDGNDTLIGGHASDRLIGGAGNDDFRVEETDDRVEESVGGGFDRIYSEADYYFIPQGQEVEFLAFSDPNSTRNASLEGNEFGQTIIGSAGNNTLNGRGGADIMAGLAGDDAYLVENAGDVVLEGVGGGRDIVYVALANYTLTPGSEVEVVASPGSVGTSPFNLTGNEFANYLQGTNGINILIGGGGDDTLDGLGGNDIYRIEDFGDVIIETTGRDSAYIAMNLSGYTLGADIGIDVLAAIDPTSTITFDLTGNNEFNTIFGSAGQNTLIGGGGLDTLVGFAGNDFYRVEEAGDRVVESAGNGYDSVYAVTSYALTAGSHVELLSAIDRTWTNAMDLTGNEYANEVYGSDGANVLDGKGGTDLLYGFAGADIFAFTAP